jgi:hypothetical protein
MSMQSCSKVLALGLSRAYSISKSTCIFVVTIVSCFLLEFEKNSSLVKLWYSFFNCSSSVDESTA